MTYDRIVRTLVLCLLTAAVPSRLIAAPPTPADPAPPAAQDPAAQDDTMFQPAEPDFRVINLPTTMVLPSHKLNFDLTHRFGGNLAQTSFADNVKSLFGLDSGAAIGLELRYGVAPHLQASIYRTNIDRTIQFTGKWDAVRQFGASPIAASLLVTVEATDNFSDDKTPGIGAIVSRRIGDAAALYAEPLWLHNVAPRLGETRDSFLLGMGGRVRLASTVYVTAEVTPRLAGYQVGRPEFGFGIEKRAGGHMFQLNFTNTSSTTPGQMARGASPDTLYLGFNLARKFF